MLFTPLRSVFFVAQVLVAVLAVPAPMLDSAIKLEGRSLEARAPVVKFHICTDVNFNGCFTLATELPTVPVTSFSECVNFKPEVAANVKSIRVLDTWNYAVEIHEGTGCSGAGTSILDSERDLGAWGWANRAKSARVFYYPVPHDSFPRVG